MMSKIVLDKPILLCLYGFPGSGKSYVARNLADSLNIAHISADRIRSELFSQPRFDAQENAIVLHLMNYMAEEFLSAGVGVVFDINAMRVGQRKKLKELAKKHKAEYLLIWLQIDKDSSFARTQARDKRTSDDRYSQSYTAESYDNYTASMQNPSDEQYMVISGKHSFTTQKNAIINKLFQIGVIKSETVRTNIARPDLVNLVPPSQLLYDDGRRTISIN